MKAKLEAMFTTNPKLKAKVKKIMSLKMKGPKGQAIP
jgi:hypothetical protein